VYIPFRQDTASDMDLLVKSAVDPAALISSIRGVVVSPPWFPSRTTTTAEKQLQAPGPRCVLDLKEVTLVDVEVVRFLGRSEVEGVEIVRCSQYIREWMTRERQAGTP
jgi:hypothetical protein